MNKRDTWLQVRVSREEREAFAKLSDQVRRPLSDIIRETLHEMAERVAKEREREE